MDVLDNKDRTTPQTRRDGRRVSRHHLGTRRTVALKVIHPQISTHDQFFGASSADPRKTRKVVSKTVWFQLLNVGRLCFRPIVKCIRHAIDDDHGLDAIPQDAKGWR